MRYGVSEGMGIEVSSIHFLWGADFEIPASAVPPHEIQGRLGIFRSDPLALAVAAPIVQFLGSAHHVVTEPQREGRSSVWFRCEMQQHDAGISILIKERLPGSVIVSTFVCQMKKASQKEIDHYVDTRWPAVSQAIKAAIKERYGQQEGFVWHKEEVPNSAEQAQGDRDRDRNDRDRGGRTR